MVLGGQRIRCVCEWKVLGLCRCAQEFCREKSNIRKGLALKKEYNGTKRTGKGKSKEIEETRNAWCKGKGICFKES